MKRNWRWLLLPLVACVPVLGVLLSFPLHQPIGPMYWDLAVYVDAAQRMRMGQAPVHDFFTPVGPLAYHLYHKLASAFPEGHPLLLAQWSLLIVTLPLMAMMVLTSTAARWQLGVLVGVFLLFSLLPFNTIPFSSQPGADGFGIYNRHGAELLFVLASVLLFARGAVLKPVLVGAVMLAAFWLKITAFAAGGVLCIAALTTGRVSMRDAIVAAVMFGGLCLLLELQSGVTSTYLKDLLTLAEQNGGGLVRRFLQAGSIWIGILIPAGLLCLLLLRGSGASAASLWLAAGTVAGIIYESQNTGSQGFVHLWPIALAFAGQMGGHRPAALVLAAAMLLPGAVAVGAASVRAYAGMVTHARIDLQGLGPLARVTAKRDVVERSAAMADQYTRHRDAYSALAGAGWLPESNSYAEQDFQLLHLREAASAVAAVRSMETKHGIRFGTIFALNFVNPYSAALDRGAPRHVSVGADPSRTVPVPDTKTLAAVRATDLIVRPTCPVTSANADLYELYGSAMTAHRRFELTSCTEAWLHPRFDISPSEISESR